MNFPKFVQCCAALAAGFGLSAANAQISFDTSGLNGESLNNPTTLEFGPDGRLYVGQQNGEVKAYTVQRTAPNDYEVISTETITLVKNNTPNHNDDGSSNSTQQRQVTGIMVVGTATNPVLYVTSSDWRISVGTDSGLDTNSGVISRLTCTGGIVSNSCAAWEKIDIVRGLPRSEENHSTNGMDLDEATNTLYVMQGGHANKGAPGNNFSGTPEYFLSAAMLSVDLNAIEQIITNNGGPFTDTRTGTLFVYDLPTLNDPSRTDIGNADPDFPYESGHPLYTAMIDPGDPFGGNNGLNMAITEPGGPVQIYSPGYRNAFDVVFTEDGELYTSDNGPNTNWGGMPLIRDSAGVLKGHEYDTAGVYDPGAGDYCTNEFNDDGSNGHGDPLHWVQNSSYYGGHPTPIRAFPGLAGIYIYEKVSGSWVLTDGGINGQACPDTASCTDVENSIGALGADGAFNFGALLAGTSGYFNTTLTLTDFPDNQVECSYSASASSNGQIPGNPLIQDQIGASTNGITEYTASNFGGAMVGDILTASYNGNIYQYSRTNPGVDGSLTPEGSLFSGFGSQPLDVTAQGDSDPFPGTVWAVTYGADNITVFEPNDFLSCTGNDDPGLDEDGDGFKNDDEIDNGTDPCSQGSQPPDNDGDKISDLNDPDDDNDSILDPNDPFAIDPENGLTTSLPVNYPFTNQDPGTGFYGLGFTGLMTNSTTDYLDQFDPDNLTFGGATGKATIDAVSAGDAYTGTNTQGDAFQFGINVDANTPPFVVHTKLEPPFFDGLVPQNYQSFGLQIGLGDQDNYLKVVFNDNGGAGGVQVLLETGGSQQSATIYGPATTGDLLNAGEVHLYVEVNPVLGNAQPRVSLDGITITDLGSPIALPASWFDDTDNQGLAVGIIATSNGPGPEFTATWDFMNVEFASTDAEASLVVTPGATNINASTYGNNSFTLSNTTATGTAQISSLRIDLANAVLPNAAFDPNGTAGDLTAKAFQTDSCGDITSAADSLSGSRGNGGFTVLQVDFTGFEPGESCGFSIDVDPITIEGLSAPGNPGEAGSVSGLELAGSTVTVFFDDGSVLVNELFSDGSNGGAQSNFKSGVAQAPTIQLLGQSTPTVVSDPNQTVRLTGPINADVQLLRVEGAYYDAGIGYSPGPFEISSATEVELIDTFQLDSTGTIDIPVVLTRGTESADTFPGRNYLIAVVEDTDTDTGRASQTLVVEYDPNAAPVPFARINSAGPQYTDVDGDIWDADRDFSGGQTFAKAGLPIANTADDTLYQTERYGDFSYSLTAPNDNYIVNLHLAEIYFGSAQTPNGTGAPGQREFTVNIEGNPVLTAYDIFAEVGADTAVIKSFPVTVNDGVLNIDFVTVTNNAKISAIEVLQGTGGGNAIPIVDAIGSQQVETQDTLVIPISASDGNNDPLTLGYDITPTLTGNINLTDNTDGTGSLSIEPDPGTEGSYTVTVTAFDGQDTGSTNFTLTVVTPIVNQPPVLDPIGNALVAANSNISIPIVANDPNGSNTVSLSATGLPPFANLVDNGDGTGVIEAMPLAGDAGSSSTITVTATDDGVPAETDEQIFDLVVGNAASVASFRVNAGGPQLAAADASAPAWAEDQTPLASDSNGSAGEGTPSPYVNAADVPKTYGQTRAITVGPGVPASVPAALFQTERFDNLVAAPNMEWSFPVSAGTTVELRLYFAEIFTSLGGAGERVFDVEVEGQVPSILQGIDPYAIAGGAYDTGFMISYTATVDDDTLNVNFLHQDVENPAIKGIEVLTVSPTANLADMTGRMTLQGRTDHSGDVEITLYDAFGALVSGPTTATADPTGQFTLTGITPGLYQAELRKIGYLASVQGVSLVAGANDIGSFGELRGGDANGDNQVSALDFSALATSFNLGSGDPGFDASTDFNGDGVVSALDFSILVSNYLTAGETTSAQTASILSPLDGATVTGPDIMVSWESGGAIDGLAGDHGHLRLDGGDNGQGNGDRISPLPLTGSFELLNVAPGMHEITFDLADTGHAEYPGDGAGDKITINVVAP